MPGTQYISIALVVLSISAGAASAETLDERFQAANGLFADNDFEGARDRYLELQERYQVNDASLHYNLGNTYYQLKRWGYAVLSYKRALAANPSEPLEDSIRNNLAMTVDALVDLHRKDVSKSVTVLDETHGLAYSVFHLFSENVLAWSFLVSWLLLFFGLLGRWLISGGVAAYMRIVVYVAGPLSVVLGILLLGHIATASSVVRGVVVERSARLREGRQADATQTDVPEGLEVRIIDDSDPQEVQIELSNGKRGWLNKTAVKSL